MMNVAADKLILFFPNDIWREITSYLTPEEITNLKLVCKALYKTLNSAELDMLWMPFLNRLHAIDPTVSVNVKQGEIQKNFVDSIKKAFQGQQEEIGLFRHAFNRMKHRTDFDPLSAVQNTMKNNLSLIEKSLNEIDKLDPSLSLLARLEKTDAILNELNSELIKIIIKIHMSYQHLSNKLKLHGANFSFTRIPSQIFYDPEYHQFWPTIGFLDCARQKIRFLGEGIHICTKLQELDVFGNQLVTLPKTLESSPSLHVIRCGENNLTSLSNIPASCSVLFAGANNLTEISQDLKEKFGENWAKIMMVLQKRTPRKMDFPSLPCEFSDDEPEDSENESSAFFKFTSYLYEYLPSFLTKKRKNLKQETTESSMDAPKRSKPNNKK